MSLFNKLSGDITVIAMGSVADFALLFCYGLVFFALQLLTYHWHFTILLFSNEYTIYDTADTTHIMTE